MDYWVFDIKILLLLCHGLSTGISSIAGSPKDADGFLLQPQSKQVIIPEILDASDTESSDSTDGCRDISLHKCGSSMVRVFRLLDYLPWQKSYNAKCALRKAFFSCMKTEDRPCKKRHWRTSDTRFRKKLARSLWSTRGCVLGALPNGTHV